MLGLLRAYPLPLLRLSRAAAGSDGCRVYDREAKCNDRHSTNAKGHDSTALGLGIEASGDYSTARGLYRRLHARFVWWQTLQEETDERGAEG